MDAKDNAEMPTVKVGSKFECNQAGIMYGSAFFAEFMQMLFGWTLQNKKFRVIIEYDPKSKTKVNFSTVE